MAEIMAEIEISVDVRERLSRLKGDVATSPQCNGNGAHCAIHYNHWRGTSQQASTNLAALYSIISANVG